MEGSVVEGRQRRPEHVPLPARHPYSGGGWTDLFPGTGLESRRPDVRRGDQRSAGAEDQRACGDGPSERELVDHGQARTERQRRPEPVSVEANRLRDELTDRSGFGRKRRRQRLGHVRTVSAAPWAPFTYSSRRNGKRGHRYV